MWENTFINLGQVAVGKEITINFAYKGKIEVIKNSKGQDDITVSCGCTSAKFNKETNTLEVKYTPKPIPKHLVQIGRTSHASEKSVVIRYKNEDGAERSDRLSFSCTVKI